MIEKSNYPNIEIYSTPFEEVKKTILYILYYILTSQLFLLPRNGGGIELLTTRSNKLQKGRVRNRVLLAKKDGERRKGSRLNDGQQNFASEKEREIQSHNLRLPTCVLLDPVTRSYRFGRCLTLYTQPWPDMRGCVCVCAQLQPHGQQPRKRSLTIPFRPRENGSPNCSSSSSEISTKLCTMR